MPEKEVAYLERRAAAEAALAQQATCPEAVTVHAELSKAYSQNAAELKRKLKPGQGG